MENPYRPGSAGSLVFDAVVRRLSVYSSALQDELVRVCIGSLGPFRSTLNVDDRAVRVIRDLVRRGILVKTEGRYTLADESIGEAGG